ncbi:peptidoglycan DD-metalloendopeptidase family protein [Ectothiorhodospiraceae bacterium WFHF3C12]|nr:peptidoglycan DD-metalloendopeptidase family protein [Ectothiorhodospiraceae bacterium WFHF3C12]
MRDRFTVTITDFRGARHYSLSQLAKLLAAGSALVLVLTLLTGGGVIFWLNSEIDRLDARRNQTEQEYQNLLREKRELLGTIEDKNSELKDASQELAEVNEDLGDIEILIGLKAPENQQDMRSRLDTASQTAREKTLMLEQIPSGYPVDKRGITSSFGWRVHPVTKERAFHNGADLRAGRGHPVRATADGVVEWAAFHERSGLGKLVILRHNFGFRTYFGHMDETLVRPGDFVEKGTVIGKVGSTGLSSAPHLHYEVRHIYRKLDPSAFLAWSLENYDALFEQEDGVKWDSLAKAVKRRVSNLGPRLSLRGQDSSAN